MKGTKDQELIAGVTKGGMLLIMPESRGAASASPSASTGGMVSLCMAKKPDQMAKSEGREWCCGAQNGFV